MHPPYRRIVTGHNAAGKAVIVSDGAAPAEFPIQSLPGLVFSEVWRTKESPARIDNDADPTAGPLQLNPPANGSVIRVIDIPPDAMIKQSGHSAADHLAEMGAPQAATAPAQTDGPVMHRTETVDYGILLSGEIWLVLDEGETRLNPGDIVIQRGTNHAWSNRSEQTARMVFILLDGRFSPEIA
jgi:hypothetical protein